MIKLCLGFLYFRQSERYCTCRNRENQPDQVLDACTHLRTFTSISEDGSVKEGTLRIGRCIDKGLCFYSELNCQKKDEELVIGVLKLIKWIGTMRNRGFGKVKITIVKE